MTECIDFVAKKAIIFRQADYSLTKLVHQEFVHLPITKNASMHATQMARGFGVLDKDITYIEDMTIEHVDKVVKRIEKSIKALAEEGKRTFLFIYCAGHGLVNKQ